MRKFLLGLLFCFLVPLYGNDPHCAYKPLRSYKISVPQHAKPLIILDAGHGGTDEGAKIHYFMEKRLTLMTTLLLRKYLNEMGYRVIMTRSKDVFIPLERRVSIANKTKAVMFVSIHYNSSPSPDAHGIEIFYHNGSDHKRAQQSKQLGSSILSELIAETHALSRGVKNGNFHVIRETSMPAVLVEGGFMTNTEERSNLRDKKYLEKIAKGVAQGIDKFVKN
ncbi:MAG: N-acetylmuramoyl-L-alanine amidase [Verrucomicrobia bacterium]|nr:N-acetylmuramoyl-L-alanine amidase [Verrucomicrobiota bacterium]